MNSRIVLADGLSVADAVAGRLFEAACTLAAMPMHGLKPAGCRVAWPEVVAEADLNWINAIPDDAMRMPRPTSDAISRMDEAMGWISMIDGDCINWRRVVCMRMIVHPISHRYRWSWRKIGDRLHIDHHTAKSWHSLAVAVIAKKIAQPEFFTSQIPHFAA
ncbi:hypothetical protein HLH34_04365 [Gluconacetobacter azotocaptans]|uniref:DUF6362 domain-containing protein n=1 Tax=Gluconacetobacter azotocaptans TaxID=142834 RepID=A0A7W4JQW1_9PROT|nr:DUF6362 family protein [Gluconacetobacter azotocaptans]MBB2189198.1 hypothetical protein [Gluconacetobacter azotocaptans]GBQ32225.1 hypothetical protein AA13594_2306 [Gluconacetobacter azotocaptans DSM 13594]